MKRQCSECGSTDVMAGREGTAFSPGASRRKFIKTLAAAGAVAMLPAGGLLAQNASRTAHGKTGRVDVHHHPIPPSWKEVTHFGAGGNWSPTVSIEQMDKYGIATSILSITTPGLWFGGPQGASKLSRECNEYMAKMVGDYKGRFGMFTAVPFPDQDATLREIEYGYDTLKADGVGLLTSYGDKWLGDPAFVPAFEEMNRRNAVVFVHVTGPSCCSNLVPGARATMDEFDFDLTRTVVSMLVNGTFSRFPKIRFIFVHSGGTLPVLAGRIHDRFPKDRLDRVPDGVLPELKRQYYEVAHATYGPPLAALDKFVPTSQMLFGTDYPAEPIETTVGPLGQFGFSAKDLHAINRGNAERLFPRLKA
jgi:predicted TIM-barrel fold metal-dependent hydrolase